MVDSQVPGGELEDCGDGAFINHNLDSKINKGLMKSRAFAVST